MHKIIQPEGWAKPKGYANGVLADNGHLFIGGQIGWNADQKFEEKTFPGQTDQALKNILAVVEEAGGGVENIVRLNWFVKDKTEYCANQRAMGEIYRRVLGRHFPAMTMVVVKDLVEDEALIEIEATAVL